jgi:integrase
MATVVEDPRNRSPFWYACFTTADGRRLKKSTKETNQAKAKLIAETLQRAENLAKERDLTEVRTRELLSDVLERTSGRGLRVFTVAEWFSHFVKGKRKSRADKTALRHEQMMDEFIDFIGSKANLNVAAITSADIAAFRDHRESQGLAPSTLNTDITVLAAAFNSALKQGHISVNPCATIEPVKDKNVARKKTFTSEQVTALIKAANDPQWKGLILLAFYSGQRLGDCANVQWKQIDMLSEIKTIRFEQGKTGAVVVVVIHPVLEDYLLSLPAPKTDDAFLFPSLAQRNISPLSKAFKKIMAQANIEQRVIRQRSESGSGRCVNALTFHSLRHSFSSILANAGISEETRMALTGHVTREEQKRYTHHDLEVFRAAIGMLPRVGDN